MSSHRRALALPATAPSVRMARSWVRDSLAEIGRQELVESAQLGVSELVTNALLHAEPPVEVRLRGTREHPRIEVADRSPVPPRTPQAMARITSGDIPTFGRGLSLVAMMSSRWGADLDHDRGGKSVWFEPAPQINPHADLGGEVFDPDEAVRADAPLPQAEQTVRVELRHLPAQLFRRLRVHHFELRREMRLLAMVDPDRYPVARRAVELGMAADADRRATKAVHQLDQAITRGEEHVDLVYDVPLGAPERMAQLHALIREIYEIFGSEQLLTLVPPPELLALQDWYFGQFARQAAGEPPVPWSDVQPARQA